MTMQGWVIVIVGILYLLALFAVASIGDRRAASGKQASSRPYIYALSIAIYCTSWTFFGSVGQASERGLQYLAIYIGPFLVFAFGSRFIRRIIRLSKTERITSIADFLGARYGKSFAVACVATLIATIGTIPYIALQLKAIAGSVALMASHYNHNIFTQENFLGDISFLVAILLAIFAILFGTRHADATEHQDGLMLAVSLESVVKLTAFLAIGIVTTFIVLGGIPMMFEKIQESPRSMAALTFATPPSTWLVIVMISAFAIFMLPRQFHVAIVENRSEDEVTTAAWLFPLYLIAINLFVLPIAFAGKMILGNTVNSDLYVLALPMTLGWDFFSLIAFIGGLSAATAMVIVASVALSIMVSNDLVLPLFLTRFMRANKGENDDWSGVILNVRRTAIFLILICAFIYYRETTNNVRLASIGLLSFAAIAQFAPAMLGGLIWRRANARGALCGMIGGFAVWAYTLLLPSITAEDNQLVMHGLLGLSVLRPQALFGSDLEPLTHGVLWSLAVNTSLFVVASLSRVSTPLERIQASIFVPRDNSPMPSLRRFRSEVTVNEVKEAISRYLGSERTERSFRAFEEKENMKLAGDELAGPATIHFSEQLLASAIGSSSARLVLSLLFRRSEDGHFDAIQLLDDASEALQQNRDLLQIALDQMEQGITVLDRDYRLTCWNRRFRNLLDLPDEMGQVGVSLVRILNYLEERGEIQQTDEASVIDRISRFGEPWQFELAKSGKIIEIRSNPMPDGGLVATYSDITERVRAALELERANENLEMRVASRTAELTKVNAELAKARVMAEEANLGKTRFLAAAGHDILQPLNAARLYCSALTDKIKSSGPIELTENLNSSLDSVEAILGAVLDISRLDTGALKPDNNLFRLDSVLKQIETDFQPLANEKGLELRVIESSVPLYTDRNLLRRLIQNLVSNAIKYTRNGRILVGVRRRGKNVEIQVHDTGIGIAENERELIFSEFKRLDSGAREASGLGLGLSIVDRIARVLGLQTRFFSRVGHGSTFCVFVPVAESHILENIKANSSSAPTTLNLAGLTVLCIDNDPRILDGMTKLLQGWGCEVLSAKGSGEFLSNSDAQVFPPSVVLADYHLDGENGIDVIGRIRQRFGVSIPAVLITADRSNDVRSRAAEIGVSVLNKPIKPAALRLLLRQIQLVREAAE